MTIPFPFLFLLFLKIRISKQEYLSRHSFLYVNEKILLATRTILTNNYLSSSSSFHFLHPQDSFLIAACRLIQFRVRILAFAESLLRCDAELSFQCEKISKIAIRENCRHWITVFGALGCNHCRKTINTSSKRRVRINKFRSYWYCLFVTLVFRADRQLQIPWRVPLPP